MRAAGCCLGVCAAAAGGGALNQEDFPALPSMSRNQRRKQRERERAQHSSLASRLAAAAAPIRVVNRAAAPTPAEAAAAAAGSRGASSGVRHSQSAGNLLAGGSAPASGAASAAGSDGDESDGFDTVPAAAEQPRQRQDHFPALSGASAPAAQAHPAWVPVRRSGRPPKPGQASSSSKSSSGTAAAPNSISDFPSLAATTPATNRAGKAAAAASSRGNSRVGPSSSSRAAPPVQTVAEAVAAAGGVSEQLKAANKALVERCKAALSDEGFKAFREQSAGFMQGALGAGGLPGVLHDKKRLVGATCCVEVTYCDVCGCTFSHMCSCTMLGCFSRGESDRRGRVIKNDSFVLASAVLWVQCPGMVSQPPMQTAIPRLYVHGPCSDGGG
jgi:hypothetical protein